MGNIVQHQANLLPAVDPARPESLVSLPDWLSSRLRSMEGHGRPKIPAFLTLSRIQRQAVERRIGDLEALTIASAATDIADQVAELVAFYATGRSDDHVAAVKIKVFTEALHGMPSWAVAEARRRWFRGALPGGDPSFLPSPALMRAAVDGIVCAVHGQASALRRLLAAEPEREFTDQERERNHARISALFEARPAAGPSDLAAPAMGSD